MDDKSQVKSGSPSATKNYEGNAVAHSTILMNEKAINTSYPRKPTDQFAALAKNVKYGDSLMKVYRAAAPRINDLVSTKLALRFDYKKCYLYGQEWVTLTPHFYPTDTLRLDAKGMDIKEISIVKNAKRIPLKYSYSDSLSLFIHLDRLYHNTEKYTVYINYTSKPNELKVNGGQAITSAKGLYFVNPDSSEKGKPVQIWTQGETESSSVWFPTIDKPNQKTLEQISMTVPSKYVTLSNGRLISQRNNHNGTRTDTWKMDLPHAPYLFMMAVGDFKIFHDKWRGKEVNYYLEPRYAPYAKQIFGMTPEMMEYFSKRLGYDYPWNKYSQIVVRDYISGAMENTTATLHGDFLNVTGKDLIDAGYNFGRQTIVHELFHQWFGDLVTCESWSNITVNESFADFGEMLWAEYKYGKDEADAHSYRAMQNYLESPGASAKSLVSFYYNDREDMFDVVTYNKGGRILNMLRNYVGDGAFFKGLNIYLKSNAFKTGEAQQLRLAEEQASGLDLNWFFNEWYYGSGHPVLDISYKWDTVSHTETIFLKQTQGGQVFKFPVAVDIYNEGKKQSYKIWINDRADTFVFKVTAKPNLVNFDADKVLLCQKKDNKPLEEYIYQYFNAPLYIDRLEALGAALNNQEDRSAQTVIIAALTDRYYMLRIKAIHALNMNDDNIREEALPVLISSAQNDRNTLAKAAAIKVLGDLKTIGYMEIFTRAIKSESYAVQAAALIAVDQLDVARAQSLARGLEKDSGGVLSDAIANIYTRSGDSADWPFVCRMFNNAATNSQRKMLSGLSLMLEKIDNPEYVQQGIAMIRDYGVRCKSLGDGPFVKSLLNKIKGSRVKLNDDASAVAVDKAIKSINMAQ